MSFSSHELTNQVVHQNLQSHHISPFWTNNESFEWEENGKLVILGCPNKFKRKHLQMGIVTIDLEGHNIGILFVISIV